MGNNCCNNKDIENEDQNHLSMKGIKVKKEVAAKTKKNATKKSSDLFDSKIVIPTSRLNKNFSSNTKAVDNDKFIGYEESSFISDISKDQIITSENTIGLGFPKELIIFKYKIGEEGPNSRKIEKLELESGSYIGETFNKIPEGEGNIKYKNGDEYTGDFVKGVKEGVGVLKWVSGDWYFGEFLEDNLTGNAMFLTSQGHLVKGGAIKGRIGGKGIFTWANKDEYSGILKNNVPHGKGKRKPKK